MPATPKASIPKKLVSKIKGKGSAKKNFSSGKKTVTVKGASSTSKAITGLKAKKKYYVRIRTYKTVSKQKFYSSWSEVKSVKTR